MVPDPAPRASVEHPSRRRHGPWNGNANLLELPCHALLRHGVDHRPYAPGSRCTRNRLPPPHGPRLLTDYMNPREFQFVFGGFVTAWLILVIYAVSLGLRERRLRKELDRVRQMVEKR